MQNFKMFKSRKNKKKLLNIEQNKFCLIEHRNKIKFCFHFLPVHCFLPDRSPELCLSELHLGKNFSRIKNKEAREAHHHPTLGIPKPPPQDLFN